VLEQGSSRAAEVIACLLKVPAVQQQLLPRTAELLGAVQPGAPAGVQAAGWQLLEAWVGVEAGCQALLQQQWMYVFDVMVQQGSCSTSAAAAAAAPAQQARETPGSQEFNASEAAARVVEKLSSHDAAQQILQQEACIKRLLLAAMPPASDDGAQQQISSASTDTPSSSSVVSGRWSRAVARQALHTVLCMTDGDLDVGFESAQQRISLLLAVMQQTRDADLADQAADYAWQILTDFGGVAAVCTLENLSMLASMLQSVSGAPRAMQLVRYAAEILAAAARTTTGRRLLAEQSCFDALVAATQHKCGEVAENAMRCVARVMDLALPKQGSSGQEQLADEQGADEEMEVEQQQEQQAAEAPAAQEGEGQLQQQQQQDADEGGLAATSSPMLALTDQHVRALVQAAQDPLLAGPALVSCMYIAKLRSRSVLLLAPYCDALLRAVRRLLGLVGLNWAALNPDQDLTAEDLGPLTRITEDYVEELQEIVHYVWYRVYQAQVQVKEKLAAVTWEQQAAAVQFALLFRTTTGVDHVKLVCEGASKRGCYKSTVQGAAAAADKFEEGVGCAGSDNSSSRGLLWQQQQQQGEGGGGVQLTAALVQLVACSKQCTSLQELLQTSRQQL
jgi:hypothetical protein